MNTAFWQGDFFLVDCFCVVTFVGFDEKRCRKNFPFADREFKLYWMILVLFAWFTAVS